MASLVQHLDEFLKLCRPHQVGHQRHDLAGFSAGADTGFFTLFHFAGNSGAIFRHIVDCSRIPVGSYANVILSAYVNRMLYVPDNVIGPGLTILLQERHEVDTGNASSLGNQA